LVVSSRALQRVLARSSAAVLPLSNNRNSVTSKLSSSTSGSLISHSSTPEPSLSLKSEASVVSSKALQRALARSSAVAVPPSSNNSRDVTSRTSSSTSVISTSLNSMPGTSLHLKSEA
jgi:hypothetical protein